MGWLSKIVPNELKGGGWVQPLATAAGFALGGPAGAAIGGGLGAAYRGGNPLIGAGIGYLGGSLFNAASGSLSGTAAEGGSNWLQNLFQTASGGAAEIPADVAEGYGTAYGAATGVPAAGSSSPGLLGALQKLAGGSKGVLDLVNGASGAYGLYNAYQANQLAAPGRAAAKRLKFLEDNPNAINSLPGYQSGLDAGRQQLERTLAAQGQTGGGLAAEAMAKFGGAYDMQFRNAELGRLQSTAQGAVPAEREANDIVRRALEQISATFRYAGAR